MIHRVARTAAWLVAAVACALPLQALSGTFPTPVLIGLAAYGGLALVRPVEALLILTGLGPVAGVASGLAGGPFDGGRPLEAAVLILLAGSCLRASVSRAGDPMDTFEWALVAFAALAAASFAAQTPLLLLLAGHDSAAAVWNLFRHSYFERLIELTAASQTALLLEGTALAALVARTVRAGEGPRLTFALIAGAAGASALSVFRLLEVALRQPQFAEGLLNLVRRFRIAPQYSDINAAGSFFAMTALIALSAAARGSTTRLYSLAALTLIAAALWLSGSRVALASALACGMALLTIRPGTWERSLRWRPGVPLVAAVLLAGILAAPFVYSSVRHSSVGYAVFTRMELLKAGLRMLADRPVFGIGTSQFYTSFPRYSSRELRDEFLEQLGTPVTHENAHNNFLQILAELGIVGFAAFVVILVLALRGSVASANTEHDRMQRGASLALLAFLLTCLAGHPLLTPMAAYPFWTVLGLATGLAPAAARPSVTHVRRMVIAGILVLLVMLPWRMGYERREAHLEGVTFGFSHWERDEGGTRFRWPGERATLFVGSSVRLVRIPLKSPDQADRLVRVDINGRPAAQIRVPSGLWTEAKLVMPTTERPLFRRIDLRVEPAAEGGAGGASERARRVMVGRPVLTPDPTKPPPGDAARNPR